MDNIATLAKSEPARWEGAAEHIAVQFAGKKKDGLPRYLQLHAAVADLIRDKVIQPGAQMPPEQYLANMLGISLGTVQKGLQTLSVQGLIIREHGKGTFVTEKRHSLTELKHFRFIDRANGNLLPVYVRLVDRVIVGQEPELVSQLGADPKGYIRLTRLIDADGRFFCHSELYLPASSFAGLLDLPAEKLESVNLKLLFAESFDTVTQTIEESVCAARPAPGIAELIGIGPRTCGMMIEALGRTHDGTPISFHRIFVPPSDYPLDISSERGAATNIRPYD